jgi:hypothetical protein
VLEDVDVAAIDEGNGDDDDDDDDGEAAEGFYTQQTDR